jgi:hypothetical protein
MLRWRSADQTFEINVMTPKRVGGEIEVLAASTDLSVRQIHVKISGRASRGVVGEITKRARVACREV